VCKVRGSLFTAHCSPSKVVSPSPLQVVLAIASAARDADRVNVWRSDLTFRKIILRASLAASLLVAALAASAQQSAPTIASTLNAQLTLVEHQFVSAAEAMPADKYDFSPSGSNFSGVRTFALEVRHVATANFVIYSAILGQDPPPGVTVAGAANGPDNLQTREQILQYLKDSFALGHKAMASLNNANALAPLEHSPIAIPSVNTRVALAVFSFSHASDHYGQMVEYLRMNGIVPPASVGQPPANPPAAAAK
jgi:DinB superfamily